MKFACTLLVAGASLAAFGQSDLSKQTVAANPPFTLEITIHLDSHHSNRWDFANSAEAMVKAGSMIEVAIRKTNISNHEINRRTMTGQTIDVRDSSGNPVAHKKTDALQGSVNTMRAGTKDMVLQPGESDMRRGQLTDGYDLSQPGTYTVQVSEHVSGDSTSDVVKSNIITVTVFPASSAPPAQP
jgi:hypothetical protein